MDNLVQIENVNDVFDKLSGTISDSVISLNSTYGIVFIILMIVVFAWAVKNVKNSIWWLLNLALFVEFMHIIAFCSPVGDYLPFMQTIFKYDILTMFAQLCAGTDAATGLLWAQAYLQTVIGGAFTTLCGLGKIIIKLLLGAPI